MTHILYNKIFHFFLSLVFISYFDGYTMEIPSENFSQIFQNTLQTNLSSSDISLEDQLIIKEAINKIAKYQSGNNLFRILQSLLEKAHAKIVFCNDSYETRFEPGNFKTKKELLILCHINEIIGDYEAIGAQKYRSATANNPEIRLVASVAAELDEILFHELLHMKHFLEEQVGIAIVHGGRISESLSRTKIMDFALIKYSEATRTDKSAFNSQELLFFPELSELREEPLWYSFEERRTVLGPDKDTLTENAYRKEKARPLRYIYQGANEVFFDKTNCIERTLESSDNSNYSSSIVFTPNQNFSTWYSPKSIQQIYQNNKLKNGMILPVPLFDDN